MHIDLSGKVAVVSGASRGIGKAIATALAGANAYVVGTATSQKGATDIGHALGKQGRGMVYKAGEKQAATDMLETLSNESLIPDILVNNAGITRDNLLMRMKDEEWDEVITTNLTAVMHMIRAFSKPMIKARGGKIVTVSSVVASLGNAGQANYAASKAGVEGMTRALAREFAPRNITVNTVAPGYIATDMTGQLSEEQTKRLLGAIPLGRMGQPEDIAAGVLFLASEGANYITGHTLHINGGMLIQ